MMAMQKPTVTAAVVILLAACPSLLPAQQTAVSIQRAVQDGKVDVRVSSLGGATGKTIRVDVRRKVPENVSVEINPGTVFLSETGDVQNMAGGRVQGEFIGPNTYRPTDVNVMVLNDNNWHGYLVESFCMDFHKAPPRRGERFQLAIQDQRASRILKAGKEPSMSPWAFQFALWIDREGISDQDLLSRYGNVANEADLREAKKLVQQAEQAGVQTVPADMPANVRVEVQKLFSPDPAVRSAAVNVLVGMGKDAAAAAPFLADNVVTPTPGKADRSTWLSILSNPEETSVVLEQIGLPDLKAMVDAVRQRREVRRDEENDKPDDERQHPLRERILNRKGNAAESKQP